MAAALRRVTQPQSAGYPSWIAKFDFDEFRDGTPLAAAVDQLAEKPLISVLMPVCNTPQRLLDQAIELVVQQIYQDWELCIADDGSTLASVRECLSRWVAKDLRIKVVYREENGHISRATQSAFAIAHGEWIAMMDHDDILRPNALAEVALEIARYPDAEMIYSDEDKIDDAGNRFNPFFKPDFSHELFRSQNYLNHLTVHRAENIRTVGGWRPGFEGSQDYDLNLRIFERVGGARIRHIPKILYHWRATQGSTALAGTQKDYAYLAGRRALEEHVERMKLPAAVEGVPGTAFYRLRFDVSEPHPLVSLIIPTRDKVELLQSVIESIRDKTTYDKYEVIIVDNRSSQPETLAYFDELKKANDVRVLTYNGPFNFSAINNFAVAQANGTIVGLVNNDIEVISPDWLTEMVSWAAQSDIGCVGAKLYYASDTIQHAGVVLGVGGVANHAHRDLPRGSPGYFGRAAVLSNFSAVTGACLLVRKGVYQEVKGLDEINLSVAFNDIDFCLKVREAGYRNVWTPYAELYHLESKSRGPDDTPEREQRFKAEVSFMKAKWDAVLARDPFYSPHLSLERPDFSISTEPHLETSDR